MRYIYGFNTFKQQFKAQDNELWGQTEKKHDRQKKGILLLTFLNAEIRNMPRTVSEFVKKVEPCRVLPNGVEKQILGQVISTWKEYPFVSS
jgi:hypothetical protein